MKKEYIICSAVYFNDHKEHLHQPNNIKQGFVVCGRRHHNCFATFKALGLVKPKKFEKMDEIQGFITNEDRFVDRTEAARLAFVAGQIKEFKEILYS